MKASLSRATVIGRRELTSYFYSPIAYVTLTIFVALCGFIFWSDFLPGHPASMRNLFEWTVWLLVFAAPIVCMGSIAQEWTSGTIESLMTAPVSDTDVVLGKFFGALCFVLLLSLPTILFVIPMWRYSEFGHPDIGPIVSGYIGIILTSSLFVAVGLFCSSMTRNQVVAAVTSVAILFILTIVPWWVGASSMLPEFWHHVVDQLVYTRYVDFSRGTIDTGNVIFFLVGTAMFLFLTVKVLEMRRWK